jgi:hypothetical protein
LKNLFEGHDFKEDLTLDDKTLFLKESLRLFRLQSVQNPVYKDYIRLLSLDPYAVTSFEQIPFLPVGFFKTHNLKCGDFNAEAIFESSGTTSSINSKHHVKDVGSYLDNAISIFNQFYGDVDKYCILALLPSYLERNNSSLVCMVDHFIKQSGHHQSGFFLNDHHNLFSTLLKLEDERQPTILFGVTFALLDFAEKYKMQLKSTIVIETGGMKGRRKEITREELHSFLKNQLGVNAVHAEYGMTELLSQAYSYGNGLFKLPSNMKVLLRSLDDPFDIWTVENDRQQTGAINIIDLANRDSICFIATEDLGRFTADGEVEIVGRLDNTDIRGCSLLVV